MALPTDDSNVLLLHNPRCSKSRATRALLEERGVTFTERLYLEEPLDRAELSDLAARLARPPAQWVRRGEAAYAQAGLAAGASDDQLLDAMAEHPILMERPIVVRGARARVGRPPEDVLALFDGA